MRRRNFLKGAAPTRSGAAATGNGRSHKRRAGNGYYSGPVSDHFDGVNFFNPGGHPPKGFVPLLKWQLGKGRKKWPLEYPSPYNDVPPERIGGDGLRVSYVGHATVLVQSGGLNLLTDPVWSERCSPISWAGPKRKNAPGIDFDNLPPIDAVLLSHNHYDHLDLATLTRLHDEFGSLIITPLGNDRILHTHNERLNVVAGDWGDTITLDDDTRVTLEPMHHWSARGVADRRNALWAAFVIQGPAGNIYHVGDTGFHEGINYRAARSKYGGFRLAILPFGAFEPRDFMQHQHQNPDEAVRGHKLCGADFTLGHHWGTFQLTNESIDDQLTFLAQARKDHDVGADVFRELRPGQFWEVPRRASQGHHD